MLIAIVFIIVKSRNNPTDKWINKIWYINTREYCLATKMHAV